MIVYIWGNLTADNFTPRPGRDTVGRPGQAPGVSAFDQKPVGRKSQGIDLGKIKSPLMAIPDDATQGGTPGHLAIVPVDQTGGIDVQALEEWASVRNSGQTHELTQILLDAVAEPNVKGRAP